MNNPKNLTILLLCISASVMIAALAGLSLTDNRAQAATAESRAGDYIMASGQVTSNEAVVYVIDIASQRMNGYIVNERNRTVELVDGSVVDLKVAFEGQE